MGEEKNAGGRPQKMLSKEQIHEVRALAAMLSKEQIASYLGMTEKTLSAVFQRQPEVFTAYRQGKAQAILKASSALLRAVEEGDMRAIQFFLKKLAIFFAHYCAYHFGTLGPISDRNILRC